MTPRRIALLLDRWRQRKGPWAGLFEPYRGEEIVSLDCETSGLDPNRAEILSVAAVPVRGRAIMTSRALDLTLRPRGELDRESVVVHRLRRQDLSAGLEPGEALDRLLDFLGNRPVLGYHVHFDAAVLDRYLLACRGFRLPNRLVELAEVYLDRCGGHGHGMEADLRLETIAGKLGLPVPRGRHRALNDAVFNAALYVRLLHGERPR